MDEQVLVIATPGSLLVYFLSHVFTRKFDPFAPVWLFLLGYAQVYVDSGAFLSRMGSGGPGQGSGDGGELPGTVGDRLVPGRLPVRGRPVRSRRALPRPPGNWSPTVAAMLSPLLVVWGLFCAGVMIKGGIQAAEATSAEESLLRSFPFVMMVAAVMLIVTGRTQSASRPLFVAAGLMVAAVLCRDLDVQRQAISRPDRRALHGLCTLHLAREAALLAGA